MSDGNGNGSIKLSGRSWPPDEAALRAWYEKYFQLVEAYVKPAIKTWRPPRGMSASWESIWFFVTSVPSDGAKILDAGAGVTTWVFRKVFANVVTVESPDQGAYLRAIAELCYANGVAKKRIVNTQGLPADFLLGIDAAPEADYTFYDYGHFPERMRCLGAAWKKTRVAMYCDDADGRSLTEGLRGRIESFVTEQGIEMTDHRELADGYGRWGVVLTHAANSD